MGESREGEVQGKEKQWKSVLNECHHWQDIFVLLISFLSHIYVNEKKNVKGRHLTSKKLDRNKEH